MIYFKNGEPPSVPSPAQTLPFFLIVFIAIVFFILKRKR